MARHASQVTSAAVAYKFDPEMSAALKKGQARGLEIQAGSWHLEYGRGPTVTAMPFGLIDTVVSSLQVRPVLLTTSEFTKFIVKGLRRRLQGRMAR